MSAKRRKPEFRVFVDEEQSALIRTIAALKNLSISELFNEAIALYLSQADMQRLIERHRLNEIENEK
ncbi:hypothetical protein IFO70_02385 [Phormidium tenue FACHB-886]|nr:hypothetical protein [Phormidium tenue FACHB-886]